MLEHLQSDAGKKHRDPGTWQLGNWKLLRFYFLTSCLEASERGVCCVEGGGRLSPSDICIILMNALNFVLIMKCKYCFKKL